MRTYLSQEVLTHFITNTKCSHKYTKANQMVYPRS